MLQTEIEFYAELFKLLYKHSNLIYRLMLANKNIVFCYQAASNNFRLNFWQILSPDLL